MTSRGLRGSHGLYPLLHYSAAHLLVSLVLLLASTPFIGESSDGGDLMQTVLVTVVLISAGLAAGGRKRMLGLAMLLLLPTVAATWTHHVFPHLVSPAAHLSISILFIGFVIFRTMGYILKASRVDSQVICAGTAICLLIGLLWAFAYSLVAHLSSSAFAIHTDPSDPQQMTNFNCLYFSYTTLTTLGIGDITPVSKVARTLVYLEAMTGMLYVAILITRLVALYNPQKPEAS
jgi:voltage-gated potassium channel